ncbi:putative HAD-hydrolase YfnB [bioreactor metagenome]|uniref:Putative HAD-hydrolase YfnB n=1 Tax=bioreactor metagenome TaxID=1076179 RepID=A0A644WN47_9ZZZZ
MTLRYEFVLFDADNTLFDFDLAEHKAFYKTMKEYGIACSEQTETLYRSLNQELWTAFNKGMGLPQEKLVIKRFSLLLEALKTEGDPAELNRAYLANLGAQAILLPGALELCRRVSPFCTLAIVTNGVPSVQHGRFDGCPLASYFTRLFISGEMGCQKPQRAFFDRVCEELGIHDRRRAVVVGDNLSSDIMGGINAGIDTIWYNPFGSANDPEIWPTWEAHSYEAVEAILLPA